MKKHYPKLPAADGFVYNYYNAAWALVTALKANGGQVGAALQRAMPKTIKSGYEVSDGEYVVLSNDEIKAADQPARKAIELEDFVPGDQIDPVFYDKPYYLAPQKGAEEAYALLAAALEKTKRVGIGRVVLHGAAAARLRGALRALDPDVDVVAALDQQAVQID